MAIDDTHSCFLDKVGVKLLALWRDFLKKLRKVTGDGLLLEIAHGLMKPDPIDESTIQNRTFEGDKIPHRVPASTSKTNPLEDHRYNLRQGEGALSGCCLNGVIHCGG